ncbi:hypothetical protein M5K25_013444 [Dendrobium thyrsiflorum]|uniref:Uncharacterized protein n=1 Tax=Dendrobium thyrsiflorum TaxID=117978 RepID=A0ABD0V0C9_DENTH
MTSRRIFLRSYPLRWEEQEEELADEFSPRNEVLQSPEKMRHCSKLKSLVKNNLIEMFNWGQEKLILLKKIKNKSQLVVTSDFRTTARAATTRDADKERDELQLRHLGTSAKAAGLVVAVTSDPLVAKAKCRPVAAWITADYGCDDEWAGDGRPEATHGTVYGSYRSESWNVGLELLLLDGRRNWNVGCKTERRPDAEQPRMVALGFGLWA